LRDISAGGLGLTVPYDLELYQQFQVELFSEAGTLIGRMRSMHCTQTIGGYKLGLQWIGPLAERAAKPRPLDLSLMLSMPPGKPQSEVMTLSQAREEIRQALRKYYVATVSRGLLGLSMEREIARIVESLPVPEDLGIRCEPRRQAWRHEVVGQVHLASLAPQPPMLSNYDIADISLGGARVIIVTSDQDGRTGSTGRQAASGTIDSGTKESAASCEPAFDTSLLQPGTAVVLGLWTQGGGTVWLPAGVVHRGESDTNLKIGLQFSKDIALREFR
jgi:hypothetical protein